MNDRSKLMESVRSYLLRIRDEAPKWKADKNRASWADEIFVGFVNALDCLDAAESFYRGKKRREPQQLLAHKLEEAGGLITTIQTNLECRAKEIDRFPNEEDLEVFQMAVLAFHERLREITGIVVDEAIPMAESNFFGALSDCLDEDSAQNRDWLARSAHQYGWCLSETAYRLKLLEHKIWLAHPKWELAGYQWEPDGPFDCREWMKNRANALKKFDADHPDLFAVFHDVWDSLQTQSENRPVLFVHYNDYDGSARSFAAAVKEVLTLNPYVYYEDPVMTAVTGEARQDRCEPSPGLTRLRGELLSNLCFYFDRRALGERLDSPARRLWLEAEAELFAQPTWQYDNAAADRVIALANAAQRESWIQGKLHGSKKDNAERIAINQSLAPEPPEKKPSTGENDAIEERLEAILSKIIGMEDSKEKKPKDGGKEKYRRGPKTSQMQKQLDRFKAWLSESKKDHVSNRVIDNKSRNRTVYARANQFWNEPVRKTAYDKAAKARGQKKGYSSYKTLADAYTNSLL